MKKHFKGYYKLTPTQIQRIWENGFISLDANSIFNLYRYSEGTSQVLLRIFQKYSAQLWITYQSAYEFHKNRINVITEQIKTYTKTRESFKTLENDITRAKNIRKILKRY